MGFDLAIIETENGGDLQKVGNDLAVVYGNENQVYLAWFGGNVEQNTEANVTLADSKDFWGNGLLFPSQAALQFNSNTERILNTTALTSVGRVKIENAIKSDLKFMSDTGITITVVVSIVETNKISVELTAIFPVTGNQKVAIINFIKKAGGDFFAIDFNNDFFI